MKGGIEIALAHRFDGGAHLEVAFTAPGGVTALFGRSGAGKTSVIRAVAGLLRPASARIIVGGRCLADTAAGIFVPVHRRRLGYVFQDARLFPHMSVEANLLYGARLSPAPPEPGPVIELLGLGRLLGRRPASLSGGEAQRVAIGRALLSGPDLLLMDEPLSSLDAARKDEILPYLERLRDEAGVPMLHVSHDIDEVARLADTLVLLEGGRSVRTGPAAEVLSDPEAAPLVGIRNAGAVLSGRVATHHPDGLTEVALSTGRLLVPQVSAPPGTALRLRIPAEDVIVATEAPRGLSALNALEAVIEEVRIGHGPGVMLRLASGGDRILARVTRRSAEALGLTPGRDVHAVIKTVSVSQHAVGGVRPEEGERTE